MAHYLDYDGLVYYHNKLKGYIADELEPYAKKEDLTTVFKYKGSVDSYAELPTDPEVGDVYNFTTDDEQHGYKAGDNVVWNGTEWDDLSGIVDLSGYQTVEAAAADKQELQDAIDALEQNVTNNYVTNESLSTTLEDYVLKSDLDASISRITEEEIDALFE